MQMTWLGCLIDEFTLSEYFLQIDRLNDWFKNKFLELNVSKTTELVFHNSSERGTPRPISLNQQEVEVVSSSKYVGTVIDQKMTFSENTDMVLQEGTTKAPCSREI